MTVPEETVSKISELRNRISDEIPNFPVYDNDWYLYYWLRANGMSVTNAEKKLRKSMAWRKEILEPPMLDGEFQTISRESNHAIIFSPDSSSCVGFNCTHATDIGKLLTKYGPKLYKFMAISCQRMETFWAEHMRKNARSLDEQLNDRPRSLYIVDFGVISLRRSGSPAVMNFVTNGSSIIATHFPGLVSRIFFINVGPVTGFLSKMCLPLFQTPGSEIKAFGDKDQQWRAVLLEHLEPEEIPEHFGGKKSWPISR